MSALRAVMRAGVRRRRVQTVVIGLVTMVAVTASVLAGALLVASNAPFDNAFARQNGAHLSVAFDPGSVTDSELSDTASAEGVAAAVGPFPAASLSPTLDAPSGPAARIPQLKVVGRDDPGGGVDEIDMVSGRWVSGHDEIVLSADGPPVPVGTALTFADLPDSPTLTVVGTARSVSRTADAWTTSTAIDALKVPGMSYQMLYRFDVAASSGDVTAGEASITADLPDGAWLGSQSWLAVKEDAAKETAVYVPFLIGFGTLGLVMSVLIVGNVISGAVSAGSRRIGILKSLGFTPRQVVRAYLGQALVPSTVGAVLGVVAGNLLAIPLLSQAEDAYRTIGLSVPLWLDAVVLSGVLGVVSVTAFAAARRAGRLRTVDALAVGRSSSSGRGRRAARVLSGTRVPRPVSLGLARPFARPARSGAMVAAVLFGAAAVTFSVGLSSSLNEVLHSGDDADVTVLTGPPELAGPGDAEAAPDAIADVIDDQTGTDSYYTTTSGQAAVAGISGSVDVVAYGGDASDTGREMVSGRWFTTAGEAVAPTGFLTATGTDIGDAVTLTLDGTTTTVTLVGEVFSPTNDGMQVFTAAETLPVDLPQLRFFVNVQGDTDVDDYLAALTDELEPVGATAIAGVGDQNSTIITTLNALAAMLTLMLVAVAALGVLNGVLLDTRDRVQDLGIHKALGMLPRQTVAMVVMSVVVPGVAGAAIGVPLGVVLHAWIVPAMADGSGLTLPASFLAVFDAPGLTLLGLGGVLIAIAGSLLPAGWAARTRTATALRTE